MHRPIRLLLLIVVLLALGAGVALGIGQPATERAPAPLADDPADAAIDQALVDRLAEAGLQTDLATLDALAAEHGLGGAVRLLGWAQETGRPIDQIAAKRAEGMGWGQIAKELDTHPGIGRWMRGAHPPAADAADGEASGGEGQGRGRDTAPGQAKRP